MSYISKFPKNTAWRDKVLKSLANDVILYNKVTTSYSIANRLVRLISRLITFSKKNTLHSRRLALRYLGNKERFRVMKNLFGDIREKYANREGGYTRTQKAFIRRGDNSLRVFVSLV